MNRKKRSSELASDRARGGVARVCAWWAGVLLSGSIALGQATTKSVEGEKREAAAAARDWSERPTRVNWWNDAVFYQVFVRSFSDSRSGKSAGDGIGDLRGLIERLDYLNDGDASTKTDLGLTGLWLMPICPSPSYHGYDVTDYRAINPAYGTMDDFRELVTAARARGIRVIVDTVMNHTSDQHPWFVEAAADANSPKRDWYLWAQSEPGYRGPWDQQVWHRTKRADPTPGDGKAETVRDEGNAPHHGGEWYYGLFSGRMPDLNFRNEDVTKEWDGIAEHWLKEADGFRLDAIRHLIEDGRQQDNTPETFAWLQEFRTRCKNVNPDGVLIGEVWAPTSVASRYVDEELDLVFEFDLASALIDAARRGRVDGLRRKLAEILGSYPPNQFATFLSNHDQTRVATRVEGDEGALRCLAGVLMTGPGVPFVYYGEEIGVKGDKPDEDLRLPMPWNANAHGGFSHAKPWRDASADYAERNVQAQSGAPDSLLSWYRDLIALRSRMTSLRCGWTRLVEAPDLRVLGMMRGSGDELVLVLANFSPEKASGVLVVMDEEQQAEIVQKARVSVRLGSGSAGLDRADEAGTWRVADDLEPWEVRVIEFSSE